ncbi:hypothetical protein Misp01_79910 [Microtetraspora sp. NBRC 13810]|uniref:hypothetical protein n=1 Tax=Microtetraspora sp. NBRC 13810 TaxID=3030990 RepID=UPI0024A3473C|nr:hypothetical protein [Microtetraspora sp. NBRC 13810]GLW12863.1 hypothetical protein Misp01_79910 [Microtetraspora sp. NBRC 13810]
MPIPSDGPSYSSPTLRSAKNRLAQAERRAAQQARPGPEPNSVSPGHSKVDVAKMDRVNHSKPVKLDLIRLNQAKVDPGFFQRVMKLIKAHNRPIYAGLAVSGLAVTGTAMVAAAVGNMSNPFRFFEDRGVWNEMLGDLKLSAWDVWVSYFSVVSPYWGGHASETVQRYLRFQLIGMFDELGRVATEMSNTLTGLAWDVVEYDLKLVALLVSAGTAFAALLPFRTLPAVKIALGGVAITFLTLLTSLIDEFIKKIKALDLKLQTLGQKIFELRGLFTVGDDKLHLQPPGFDPNLWEPVTMESS